MLEYMQPGACVTSAGGWSLGYDGEQGCPAMRAAACSGQAQPHGERAGQPLGNVQGHVQEEPL
jgi:hypothetical protein